LADDSQFTWDKLLGSAVQLGTAIYQGQLVKRQQRQMARAGASDFPQLGMGLAATGPQRTTIGIFDSSGAGVGYSSTGAALDDMSGGGSMVAVGRGSRFPTQLVVYTTPSGRMQVGGYRNIGVPVLWSGDFTAARRLARAARRLGAFRSHRRGYARPR